MSYPVSIILLLLLAAGAGWGATRVNWKFPALDEKKLVWRVSVLFFLVYLGILYYKLEALQMGGWDFGIYDSMLHNAAAGKGLMLDYRGYFDHFSPVFMLFAPLYMIWDHPFWLLLIQSAAMAFAAPIFYAVARRYFPRGRVPLLLTFMYLLNPYYSRLTLYDFHIECLFPLVFFGAFYFYSRKKLLPFALLLMFSPMLKEDFVIPVAATGLWLLTRKGYRKLGLAAIGVGLFWTFFVLKVYYPYILGVDYWHYGRYVAADGGVAGAVNSLLAMARRFVHTDSLLVMLSVLLPFALLPLCNWKMILFLWLPVIGIHLVADNPSQLYLLCHYCSALLAVTPVAALWGARTLRVWCRRRAAWRRPVLNRFAWGSVLAVVCIGHVIYSDLPLSRYYEYIRELRGPQGGVLSIPLQKRYWDEMGKRLQHAWEFREIIADLPLSPDTVMVCQNELSICFYRKARVFDFPELGMGNLGSRPENADIYVLDSGNFVGNADLPRVNEILQELANNPEYQVIRYPNGILIIIRKKLLLDQNQVEPAAVPGGQQIGL